MVTFQSVYASQIYPDIQGELKKLSQELPTRLREKEKKKQEEKEEREDNNKKDKEKKKRKEEEGTPGTPIQKLQKNVLEKLKERQEARCQYMNLAWTGAVDNQPLEKDLPYQKVVNFAVDLFMNTADATQRLSLQAAEGGEQKILPSVVESMIQNPQKDKLPWKIPELVPKGYEIPIVVTSTEIFPELGKFKGYGMDIAVNATWLAYWWAIKETNEEAQNKLKALILDWPMDFKLLITHTLEEFEDSAGHTFQ